MFTAILFKITNSKQPKCPTIKNSQGNYGIFILWLSVIMSVKHF